MLSGYTSAHSMRHVVGGIMDAFRPRESAPAADRVMIVPAASTAATGSGPDESFTVAFSDIYIRLCSMGIWTDWRIF
jgi:hypothetical protein